MNNKTRKWIRAGVETFIHGGTAAVTSSATAGFIDPKDWHVGSSNQLKLAGIGFLLNGGIRLFQWWNNNPLPPEDDTAPPVIGAAPLPMISINPLSKVTQNATFEPPTPVANPPKQP